MNAKQSFVAFVSAFALIPAGSKLSAEPLIFFFSGQITERRAQNSVFTEPNTDQFYGYFSYDTAATANFYGLYPLLSFSIDGNWLNSANDPYAPGLTGVSVNNDGWTGIGDTLKIQGVYPCSTEATLGCWNGVRRVSTIRRTPVASRKVCRTALRSWNSLRCLPVLDAV